MKRQHAVAVLAVAAVVGAGGAWARMAAMSGSSLDADERAMVEEVARGSHNSAADAARFVDANVSVLLSKDVIDEIDGADLAAVFEVALEGESADGLFETVVSAVAEEGEIHSPALRPVLGDTAAARLAWFDARINAFTSASSDQWDEPWGPYDEALRFLREVMRDPGVADRLRQSMADYGRAEVAAAPGADGARTSRLMGVGGFQAFFTLAYFEAEEFEARLDRSLHGVEDAEAADQERRRERLSVAVEGRD